MALYTNNHTPVPGDSLGSYDEATFAGYGNQTIADWGSPTTPTSGTARTVAGTKTFTRSSTGTAETCYGYYVFNGDDDTLLWAELFSSPITVTNAGDFIAVVPRWDLSNP